MLLKLLIYRYITTLRSGALSIQSALSISGVALAVASLIVVSSVMNGFRKEIVDSIVGINGHINIVSQGNLIENHKEILHKINEIDGILSIKANIQMNVALISNHIILGAYLHSVSEEEKAQDAIISKNIKFGGIEGDGAIIGINLARNLRKTVGDSITLVSQPYFQSPFGIIPEISTHKIDAVIETGIYDYDDNLVYITEKKMLSILNSEQQSGANTISLYIKNIEQLDSIKKEIRSRLGRGNRLIIKTWMQNNAGIINAIEVERSVMLCIMSIIIVLASFAIFATTTSFVRDRKHSIAMLKVFGMANSKIIFVFCSCGFLIGVFGIAIGTLSGIVISGNIDNIRIMLEYFFKQPLMNPLIHFLGHLPSIILVSDIIKIVSLSCFTILAATIIAAKAITKNKPNDILKNL